MGFGDWLCKTTRQRFGTGAKRVEDRRRQIDSRRLPEGCAERINVVAQMQGASMHRSHRFRGVWSSSRKEGHIESASAAASMARRERCLLFEDDRQAAKAANGAASPSGQWDKTFESWSGMRVLLKLPSSPRKHSHDHSPRCCRVDAGITTGVSPRKNDTPP